MNRLRELRENLDWSQQRLADAVEPTTSQAQIDRLEKGERKLTVEWARRLAKALGCHWTEIYPEDERGGRAVQMSKQMAKIFETLSPKQQEALYELAQSMVPPKTEPDNDDAPAMAPRHAARGRH